MIEPVVNSLRFRLESWAAWAPDLTTPQAWLGWAAAGVRSADGPEPAVAKMPAMLRRRAQRLGRMALEVLYAEDADAQSPIVFASRYGEIGQSTQLLHELAASGTVSPQAFSMSVHNAIAGLYTIARKESANVMALAAGTQTAFAGLFEAAMQLADGAPRVRLVICDEPLPAEYQCYGEPSTPTFAYLLTLVPGDEFDISWSAPAQSDADPMALLRFMLTAQNRLPLSTSGWCLARRPA
ncbi:beta-ketoacyl synthase chain length factor [Silvimonas soli]|uniref:beta-ketoacyl synthase chain length factor n=1 Tax=Silvimonas soli TaxID=2980100 RepID=UPI0024B32EA2|nr:beta-ketoacyl synthase chain length factor [Silvimonas soli]